MPEGWIVVTAGNPPEYNQSVREFDIVTWDRLKRIDCEPDFEVWKEYAIGAGVHPSVLTYLEIRPEDFYSIESTVDGKTFVTARGWDDLSQMIILYEYNDIIVDEKLVRQYVQDPKIAKRFSVYYDLFNKYKSDYQVEAILKGEISEDITARAKAANFDERISFIGLLSDAVSREMKRVTDKDSMIKNLLQTLKVFRKRALEEDPSEVMGELIAGRESELTKGRKAGSLSQDEYDIITDEIEALTRQMNLIAGEKDGKAAFAVVKRDFDGIVKSSKDDAQNVKQELSNMFRFCEEAFGEGQELFLVTNNLTVSDHGTRFLSRYGCDEYFRHNKDLMLYDKEKEIDAYLEGLDEED